MSRPRRAPSTWVTDQPSCPCADGVLLLSVTGPDDSIARLEDVVGRHLVRFGAKDELVVTWARDDGHAGTEQRNTED